MTENILPGRFVGPVSDLQAWPALHGSLPTRLRYERGIWGKAHGARSDFRWLARSPDFGSGGADLGRRLNLGLEDRPRVFTAWNVVGGSAYAITAYPSRATDASGRRGFLEKQILEWRRDQGEPAVAVALTLLVEAARLDDEDWWTRQSEVDWTNPESCLFLSQPDVLEDGLSEDGLSEDRLTENLAEGLAELRSRVGEDALTGLYAGLLGERVPACLPQDEPLPPRALACLLLPLPRELADRLSISSWIPSKRQMPGDLARRWDLLAGPVYETPIESREAVWEQARRMAQAVLRADPSELEDVSLSEDGLSEDAGAGASVEVVGSVHEFPTTSSWHDWTSAMRRNLTRTTDRLIEQELWSVWRRHARLQPRERLTTALAWLTSEVWIQADAPPADIDTWNEVLDDIATLKSAHMKRLCRDWGPSWPWIPSHEGRQLADLAAMAANLGDLARLAESVESDLPGSLASQPLYRRVLEESRYAGRLPADALLWLLDRRECEPPALDAKQWELLRNEAGDRLDVALAARDLPDTSKGKRAGDRFLKWGWGSFLNLLTK